MAKRASARNIRRDVSGILCAPRRMPVADAVSQFMRVPMGAGNSVPWDPDLAPYVIEPMNCLASREYDAVVFVGPARTGKTIGLIDGWIVYNVVCDPADSWQREGFTEIPIGEMQPGDVVLMKVRAPVTNHSAVYLGNNLILHHMFGHLSSRIPLGEYWRERIVRVVRHKELFSAA